MRSRLIRLAGLLSTASFLIVALATSASAQSACDGLPGISISDDGSAVVVHNSEGYGPYSVFANERPVAHQSYRGETVTRDWMLSNGIAAGSTVTVRVTGVGGCASMTIALPSPVPATPTTEPVPVTPTTEPIPEPVPVKAPASEPVPVKAPASEPVPVKAPASGSVPVKAPSFEPVPVKEPAPEPTPARNPASEPVPVKEVASELTPGLNEDASTFTPAKPASSVSGTPVSPVSSGEPSGAKTSFTPVPSVESVAALDESSDEETNDEDSESFIDVETFVVDTEKEAEESTLEVATAQLPVSSHFNPASSGEGSSEVAKNAFATLLLVAAAVMALRQRRSRSKIAKL